ncbi:MAG: acetyl-CoA carboxylase biotin carboxyl carrier protein subunit [Balneolaceae bacterium]
MQFETTVGDKSIEVSIDSDNHSADLNDESVSYELIEQDKGRKLLRIGTKLYKIDNVTVDGQQVEFTLDGKWISATVKNEQELLLERLGFKTNSEKSVGILNAPMPGKILSLLVSVGDEVELGQPVAILEAMKMENELKAPCDGAVVEVSVSEGDNVEKNQPLLEIEPRG